MPGVGAFVGAAMNSEQNKTLGQFEKTKGSGTAEYRWLV
jgi:hypothetical protein